MAIIYVTENLYNFQNGINPWRYIGSDQHNNPNYFGSSRDLKSDVDKLGSVWFVKKILLECGDIDNKSLRWIEAREFLKPLKVKNDPTYYNKTEWYAPGGGVKGMKHAVSRSEEHRRKIVEHRTGSTKSDEARELMRLRKLGKKYTEERKEKLRQVWKKKDNPNALLWTIISPDGEIFEVFNLKKWAIEQNYSYRDLYHNRKGWTTTKHGHGRGGRTKRGES